MNSRDQIISFFCVVLFLLGNNGCKENTSSEKNENKSGLKKPIVIAKEKWHWGREQKQDETAGYAQVVRTGNTLYISGIPTNDLSDKGVAQVYKALEKCLNAYGASSKDVVKENLYTTDMEAMKKYNNSRKKFYNGDFPAATWVQVSRLYEADAKLEVDLIAVIKGDE